MLSVFVNCDPAMKPEQQGCVVLSDYPIKMMAYRRFLSGLGESTLHMIGNVSSREFRGLENSKLVVCDMNVMRDQEPQTLALIKKHFPSAQILFLEEDHCDLFTDFDANRDVCHLGKLAEINVIHATIKELLLQTQRGQKKTLKKVRKLEQA